jgi:hypothetical protein
MFMSKLHEVFDSDVAIVRIYQQNMTGCITLRKFGFSRPISMFSALGYLT